MERHEEGKKLTCVPGEWVIVSQENGKRKAMVKKDQVEKKKRTKGGTKTHPPVAFQCTNDVQTIFNWLAERLNMLSRRIGKKSERFAWEGFQTRYYTTVKVYLFLDLVKDQFMSDDWFGKEIEMIQDKGYIYEKPETEGVHGISNQ